MRRGERNPEDTASNDAATGNSLQTGIDSPSRIPVD
jgi:hypothetical protein